ncbi:hypothetical protein PFICI_00312 [Pestalotiopsis fici W106-1]|uniref:Protein kinase domain-containing protein n=1 Tax=Pestalotiopsis fici (strain W106-1 / CGMCC3.15140) TaxID=1229662 RepID=W3XKE2_PESFW|nr:uncharacterized protein PFICI_00312 [Pestalotiopsis fici W106-1]ETS86484.1 hypothetical protein PFICI_00312 [Pestalotiopsis fici W106-1]
MEARVSQRISMENDLLKQFPTSGVLKSPHLLPDIVEPIFSDIESLRLKDLRPRHNNTEFSLTQYHDAVNSQNQGKAHRLHDGLIGTFQTCSIFRSLLEPATRLPNNPKPESVAVKRFHSGADFCDFVALKERLRKVNQLQHLNLVETIAAFCFDDNSDSEISWNFISPLAPCDLRQLFHYQSPNGPTIPATQFEALASALAYLHGTLEIAHRSIRPSNILVYHVSGSSELVLKLANFSSSVDLSQASAMTASWEVDTGRNQKLNRVPIWDTLRILDTIRISETVFANDVLTLGCVFVELVAFMTEGRQGVVDLRRFITTTNTDKNISTDAFYSGCYEGELLVKQEVLSWMKFHVEKSSIAKMAYSTIERMLDDVPVERWSALQSLDPRSINPSHGFTDGHRILTFTASSECKQPLWFDKLRISLEHQLGSPIDWSPLPQVIYPCQEGQMRVTWKYGKLRLSKVISSASAKELMDMCRGLLTTGRPLLPTTSTPLEDHPVATGFRQPHSGSIGLDVVSVETPDIELLNERTKEIYLCVDKILVEVPETKMCAITNVHILPDDEALLARMKEQLRSCNSWYKHIFSWKTCTKIKFVKFAIIKNKRVKPLGFGLPIGNAEYEYAHSDHEGAYLEAYREMIAEEVLRGIHDTGAGRDETHLTAEIPKKRNPPQLRDVRGTEAYGLHAIQGLSLKRVCWWTGISYSLGMAFVVFWLSFVDKLDLQNAFVPVTFLAAVLVGGLATTQVLV